MANKYQRPFIEIFWCGTLFNNEMFQKIVEGIEEEGVPYHFQLIEQPQDAISLAAEAALASQLEVGIGLDHDGHMAVQHRRLPENQPLFQASWPHSDKILRRFGSHAARLVKGLPFYLEDLEESTERQ